MRGARAILACAPMVLGMFTAEAHAGAWVKKRGEGLLITGYSSHWLTAPGGTDLRKSELSAYVEYGLTSRITLVGRAALQHLSETRAAPDDQSDEAFSNALVAVGGSEVGVRIGLLQEGPWALSAQLSRTLESGGENRTNHRFGVGGGDVEARLLVGRSFGRDSFVDVQLARRTLDARGGVEWRFDTALGVPVSPRWRVMAETFSISAGGRAGASPYSGHRAQLSAVYDVPAGFSVSVGVLGTLHAENVARERAGFIRFWHHF